MQSGRGGTFFQKEYNNIFLVQTDLQNTLFIFGRKIKYKKCFKSRCLKSNTLLIILRGFTLYSPSNCDILLKTNKTKFVHIRSPPRLIISGLIELSSAHLLINIMPRPRRVVCDSKYANLIHSILGGSVNLLRDILRF